MRILRRVQRIETSLTPRDVALLWLKRILEFGQHPHDDDMWSDPRRLRDAVAEKIGAAVRENFGDPRLKREQLEEIVREAQKQADALMVLILDMHKYVSSESRVNRVQVELVLERYLRLLERYVHHGEFEPEAWDSWRAMLIQTWTAIRRLRKLVDCISETCFDGHALLFPGDEEVLNEDSADLETMAKAYKRLEGDLPDWKAIEIDAEFSLIAEYVTAQAEQFVLLAKVKTLDAFGERGAARKLLDSCEFRILRELKRLRSSSEPQDSLTC